MACSQVMAKNFGWVIGVQLKIHTWAAEQDRYLLAFWNLQTFQQFFWDFLRIDFRSLNMQVVDAGSHILQECPSEAAKSRVFVQELDERVQTPAGTYDR